MKNMGYLRKTILNMEQTEIWTLSPIRFQMNSRILLYLYSYNLSLITMLSTAPSIKPPHYNINFSYNIFTQETTGLLFSFYVYSKYFSSKHLHFLKICRCCSFFDISTNQLSRI
jgi:hypothetical protein